MSKSESYLVVVDFPGIKNFVFGTDRLVEIRGGSGLLDELNREELPVFLDKEVGSENVHCIYVGGGAGQFIINADEKQISETLERFKEYCLKKSGGGLLFNFSIQDYEADYTNAKESVYQKLRQKKEEEPFDIQDNLHVGLMRECDSCSGYASDIVKHAEQSSLLCPVCTAKTKFGQNSRFRLWEEFAGFAAGQGYGLEQLRQAQPQSFEDVEKSCSSRQRLVGVIYADGNAMGRIVKEIASPEDFSFFSRTVDESIREACHEAILEHCSMYTDSKIPALILLLGGDDLLVYTTSELAIPMALSAAARFEEKTRQKMAAHGSSFFSQRLQKGMTLSLGVALGKVHTPFSLLLGQAEELLKSAKASGSRDSRCSDYYAPSYIDCHVSTQFKQIRVADSRREHLSYRTEKDSLYFTSRPWDTGTAQEIIEEAQKLAGSGIPRNRLKRLGTLPALGRTRATLEFYNILSRTKGNFQGKPRKTLLWESLSRFGCRLDEAPWQKSRDGWNTMLYDLVEMSELVAHEGPKA